MHVNRGSCTGACLQSGECSPLVACVCSTTHRTTHILRHTFLKHQYLMFVLLIESAPHSPRQRVSLLSPATRGSRPPASHDPLSLCVQHRGGPAGKQTQHIPNTKQRLSRRHWALQYTCLPTTLTLRSLRLCFLRDCRARPAFILESPVGVSSAPGVLTN